jgi:hypothetical protein
VSPPGRVAVVTFFEESDDVTRTVTDCLRRLGYDAAPGPFDKLPRDVDVLFSHGPYGRLHRVTAHLGSLPIDARPQWIHWNTESAPNLRLPWSCMLLAGRLRASVDRLHEDGSRRAALLRTAPFSWLDRRWHKFRYVGEYAYALERGYMTLLVEFSNVFADLYRRHGWRCLYAPWGLLNASHEALGLERDLAVLWIGKRRTRRRSAMLDRLRTSLAAHGATMLVVDGVEHPFVFGRERTRLLNRATITLNVLPTWYDGALSYRFPLAAANRSLVVSEVVLPHAPHLVPNVHYADASPDELSDALLHYLHAPAERDRIVAAAYRSVIDEHPFIDSVAAIMRALAQRPATASAAVPLDP